jgi:hypothetical protein
VSQRVGSAIQAPTFAHLRSLTDGLGLFEHALYLDARVEHGYCTDDVARALIVVLREDQADPAFAELTEIYLTFVERAVAPNGAVHNRMSAAGVWTDEPTTDDCWGRAVAALGTAARFGATQRVRDRAVKAFLRAAKSRTKAVRSASFAAIGAAELIRTRAEGLGAARVLLADCLALIPRRAYPGWDWPEPRLRYANAALCDALIVGGTALGRPQTVRQGISLLTVLLRLETGEFGQLSVCGTKGRGPGELGPLWDQQPIEVAAIADACAHAFAVTGDVSWRRAVQRAWGWFNSDNDAGVEMYEPDTGAGHDGLEVNGRNENCGAESTLAALTTLQRALEVSGVRW